MADHHLRVRPGTDAFCLAAILGALVQDDLIRQLCSCSIDSSGVFNAPNVEHFRGVPRNDGPTVAWGPKSLLLRPSDS
jgi:hypothetical protein